MKNIAIIGSGTWGVALSIHLANNGHHVKIWSFTQEETDAINNDRKCKFLPDATIPDGVECFTNMEEVINGSDLILHVTPSKFVRSTIKKYEQYVGAIESYIDPTNSSQEYAMNTLDNIGQILV